MGARLRTILFVTSTVVLAACGQAFVTSTASSGSGGESGGSGGSDTGVGASGTGTSAGAGGTGGTGGASCSTEDEDGDGYSECQLDCDDSDAAAHPQAIEVCGDGVDQDCDGAADAGLPCNGIGTFVSQKHGTVGATGTIDDPVATIGEGIERAVQIGIPTAVLVSAGDYTEALTVEGSISLVGGYDPENWAVREPATHTTKIKNTTHAGLQIFGASNTMLVTGFTIEGRQVTTGSSSTVAVTIDSGSPTLLGNTINAGPVTSGTGQSVGVRIVSSSGNSGDPNLSLNVISGGPSAGGAAYGVHLDAVQMSLLLAGNQVTTAKGTNSVAVLVSQAADGALVVGNSLQSGPATGTNVVPSASFGLWAENGPVTLDANVINLDQVSLGAPRCFTPGAWCGGVRISRSGSTVTNNVILGGTTDLSVGIQLLEELAGLADVVVNSNLIFAAGRDGDATMSSAVLLGSPKPDLNPTFVGRFRNNIFYGGHAGKNYGIVEQSTLNQACDPAALDHNLFFFPDNDPFPGVLYRDWDGVAPQDVTEKSELPGDGANLVTNPQIDGSLHLLPESPCIGTGTDEEAPASDFQGEKRPQERTYDIGPDEFTPPG